MGFKKTIGKNPTNENGRHPPPYCLTLSASAKVGMHDYNTLKRKRFALEKISNNHRTLILRTPQVYKILTIPKRPFFLAAFNQITIYTAGCIYVLFPLSTQCCIVAGIYNWYEVKGITGA